MRKGLIDALNAQNLGLTVSTYDILLMKLEKTKKVWAHFHWVPSFNDFKKWRFSHFLIHNQIKGQELVLT